MQNLENPNFSIKLARSIGRVSVDAEVIGNRLRSGLVYAFERLNPLATTNFTISAAFSEGTQKLLREAMSKCTLPEDTLVVHSRDLQNEANLKGRPFIVATVAPTIDEARKSFLLGASRYITIDWNINRLVKKLNGED